MYNNNNNKCITKLCMYYFYLKKNRIKKSPKLEKGFMFISTNFL
jgi:hypothetical protein